MTEPLKLSFTLFRPKKQRTWKILPGGSGSGRKTVMGCTCLECPMSKAIVFNCVKDRFQYSARAIVGS